jgi:hypothetical protein
MMTVPLYAYVVTAAVLIAGFLGSYFWFTGDSSGTHRKRPAAETARPESVRVPDGAGTMTGDTGELVQLDVFGVPVSGNGRHAAAAGSGT